MFLDDELENIYNDDELKEQKSFRLCQACLNRLPNPKDLTPQDFLNEIKKIEGSWKLFCTRHPEYKPDGWRILVTKHFAPSQPILKYLGWE